MDKLYRWSITFLLPKEDTNEKVVAKNRTGPKLMCRLSPHAGSGQRTMWMGLLASVYFQNLSSMLQGLCIVRLCTQAKSIMSGKQHWALVDQIPFASTIWRKVKAVDLSLVFRSTYSYALLCSANEGKKKEEIKTAIWGSNSNWTGPF